MPTIDFTLPTQRTIRLSYVTDHTGAAGQYFNAKRMGLNAPSISELYLLKVPALQKALVAEIENAGIQFDTVVCPASKDRDTDPYRDDVLERWPVRDISANFGRKGVKKAMRPETSVDDMIGEFSYQPDGAEGSIRSLLVLDESVASGKTIAAIIHLLTQAGMPHDATVAAAVCAKMG